VSFLSLLALQSPARELPKRSRSSGAGCSTSSTSIGSSTTSRESKTPAIPTLQHSKGAKQLVHKVTGFLL
jgi:hypothetical protein